MPGRGLRGAGVAAQPASELGGDMRMGSPVGAGEPNRGCRLCARTDASPLLPQNRPSVITCASASARNCNLSHCPIAHSGCAAGPASYRRAPSCKCPAQTTAGD